VIKMQLLLGVIGFALMVYCLIQAISTPQSSVRNLPKVAWVLLILFFPLVGSIAWLVAGRPESVTPLTRQQGAAPDYPEYHRPGRMASADPEKDDEFLRQVRERAEEQRRRHQEEQKRLEQQEGEDS
jgi:hypothetical protein